MATPQRHKNVGWMGCSAEMTVLSGQTDVFESSEAFSKWEKCTMLSAMAVQLACILSKYLLKVGFMLKDALKYFKKSNSYGTAEIILASH